MNIHVYVFTLLTLDMVIDLVDHVPDVYLSLYVQSIDRRARCMYMCEREVILPAR